MIDTSQWRVSIGLWYCPQIPYTTKNGTTTDSKKLKDMITDDKVKKEFTLLSEKYTKSSRHINTVSYFI